ncbi:MAG TPA: DUF3298 and DUF4163 domain-containing protein [Candidatus Limnocylindria bacterium]|nr:DUF3298 and DUF4163 domain-containing protein [Candidatus Limnocylindria bacterium]
MQKGIIILLLCLFMVVPAAGKYPVTVHEIKKETSLQSIDIRYVSFKGLLSLNELLEKRVLQELKAHEEQAQNEYDSWAAQDMPIECWPKFPFGFSVDYILAQNNEDYVSGILTFQVYGGGAHGCSYRVCFNYDVEKQKKLMLSHFISSKEELEKLSNCCREKLISEHALERDEWLLDGTAPKMNNFAKFTFTKEALTVYFDEYQVCCYALGAPKVTITWRELKA